jgi:hypothetical protein
MSNREELKIQWMDACWRPTEVESFGSNSIPKYVQSTDWRNIFIRLNSTDLQTLWGVRSGRHNLIFLAADWAVSR